MDHVTGSREPSCARQDVGTRRSVPTIRRSSMAEFRRLRLARQLAVPVLAAAVVALLPLARSTPHTDATTAWTPMSPVLVAYEQPAHGGHPAPAVKGHLLAFND